jgi:hypothetical protein
MRIVLTAAFAVLSAVPAAFAQQPNGLYLVKGTNPDDKGYTGDVFIQPKGDMPQLSYRGNETGQNYAATGVAYGNSAASFYCNMELA